MLRITLALAVGLLWTGVAMAADESSPQERQRIEVLKEKAAALEAQLKAVAKDLRAEIGAAEKPADREAKNPTATKKADKDIAEAMKERRARETKAGEKAARPMGGPGGFGPGARMGAPGALGPGEMRRPEAMPPGMRDGLGRPGRAVGPLARIAHIRRAARQLHLAGMDGLARLLMQRARTMGQELRSQMAPRGEFNRPMGPRGQFGPDIGPRGQFGPGMGTPGMGPRGQFGPGMGPRGGLGPQMGPRGQSAPPQLARELQQLQEQIRDLRQEVQNLKQQLGRRPAPRRGEE